jgi:hypothetical protein
MLSDSQSSDHDELRKLLQENQRLLIENNQMLYRMRRSAALSGVLRFLWLLIIVSGLLYTYFVYIKPNKEIIEDKFRALGEVSVDSAALRAWYEANKPTFDDRP